MTAVKIKTKIFLWINKVFVFYNYRRTFSVILHSYFLQFKPKPVNSLVQCSDKTSYFG